MGSFHEPLCQVRPPLAHGEGHLVLLPHAAEDTGRVLLYGILPALSSRCHQRCGSVLFGQKTEVRPSSHLVRKSVIKCITIEVEKVRLLLKYIFNTIVEGENNFQPLMGQGQGHIHSAPRAGERHDPYLDCLDLSPSLPKHVVTKFCLGQKKESDITGGSPNEYFERRLRSFRLVQV